MERQKPEPCVDQHARRSLGAASRCPNKGARVTTVVGGSASDIVAFRDLSRRLPSSSAVFCSSFASFCEGLWVTSVM